MGIIIIIIGLILIGGIIEQMSLTLNRIEQILRDINKRS